MNYSALIPINVLFVEDNPGDKEFILGLLSQCEGSHFRITCTDRASGSYSPARTEPSDVILLDINMRDSAGPEAAEAMVESARGIPVIVLKNSDDSHGIEAIRQGFHDCLVKGTVTSCSLARALEYAVVRRSFRRRVEEAQKLEVVGKLPGGIARDCNNLLRFVGRQQPARILLWPEPSSHASRRWQHLFYRRYFGDEFIKRLADL